MERRLDKTIKKTILKFIKNEFYVNEDKILMDKIDNTMVNPFTMSKFIVEVFNIEMDIVDNIIYKWLFKQGYKNIMDSWNSIFLSNIFTTINNRYIDQNMFLPLQQTPVWEPITTNGEIRHIVTQNDIIYGDDTILNYHNGAITRSSINNRYYIGVDNINPPTISYLSE